jgi:hypothetical protein
VSVPATSFTTKQLRVTFTLGAGNNSFQGNNNQLVLTGLRTIATISGAFSVLTQLDLQVYGMLDTDMNALSVFTITGQPTAIGQNFVLLEGNQGNGWFTLFHGLIIEGGPEYRGMPEVFFHCQAIPAPYLLGKGATEVLSYQAGAAVSDVCQSIASSMGCSFQNSGVDATIAAGAYFAGAPLDQLQALHDKADGSFNWTIDPTDTLVITPSGAPRDGGTKVVLTPDGGLVGYPTAETFGIGVVALFDPSMLLGTQIQIRDSDIPFANGVWFPYDITYQLESLQFGGQWLASMHLQAVPQ